MILNVIINEKTYPIQVPEGLLSDAVDFFSVMDRDMNAGWQMSRNWVDAPNARQRCQIAADRMLTAIENDNEKLAVLMAGYILKKLPGVRAVDIDTSGDMNQTEIVMEER